MTRVLLDHYDPKISKYLDRAKEVESVISAGSAVSSGDWELGSHMFGVTTHYKTLSSGLLCIHTEGSQDNLPIFEQLAVLNEVKLWHIYIPFCKMYRIHCFLFRKFEVLNLKLNIHDLSEQSGKKTWFCN